jgi:spore maturation protein CgeB
LSESKINTLVLFSHYTDRVSYYNDWADAFSNSPDLKVAQINLYDLSNVKKLKQTIQDYELVVCLHSTNAVGFKFLFPYVSILNKRKGKLLLFFGNELNYPLVGMRMQDKLHLLSVINPDFVASQLPIHSAKALYQDSTDADVLAMPHALNQESFKPEKLQKNRAIDIGVRAERYFPFMGNNDRNELIDFFESYRSQTPIKKDFGRSWKDRFTREGWAEFLNNCKGTIATEAGSSYLEKDDHTVLEIEKYILSKSNVKRQSTAEKFKKVNANYRAWISYKQVAKVEDYLAHKNWLNNKANYDHFFSVPFEEIFDKFYKDYSGAISGKCISSRHFDAIGCKTCQIMFPGDFNGILEANKHYLSLNPDFSNVDEVMLRFADQEIREKIVDDAYDHVIANHTYDKRIYFFLNHFNK